MSSKKVLLSVRALSKDFYRPNGSIFTALEGINLDIYDGELVAILGLSGAGKSTLLHCMAGLMLPDRGKISYATPTSKHITKNAFVFQNFALFPWMTVRENIALSIHALSPKEQEKKIDKIIQLVGLKGVEDCYPKDISGGMCQRVSLARAFVCDPMLLFLDEPFSALDPLTSQSLKTEINRLWDQKDKSIGACILVTHRLEEALQLADRVVIISSNPGRIFKSFDINIARPRDPHSKDYIYLENILEDVFGDMHLSQISEDSEISQKIMAPHPYTLSFKKMTNKPSTQDKHGKVRPLVNTNLTLVEGLISRLSLETNPMDIYELCEEMGQSINQVFNAIVAGETLGFITTPGTQVLLTSNGKKFALENDPEKRAAFMKDAILKLEVISKIYELVKNGHENGLEEGVILEQIIIMLPFEDHETQLKTLLSWCQYTNILSYDSDEKKLFLPD
jgi:NitT/TauT family transport system ATP-binding protein